MRVFVDTVDFSFSENALALSPLTNTAGPPRVCFELHSDCISRVIALNTGELALTAPVLTEVAAIPGEFLRNDAELVDRKQSTSSTAAHIKNY